MNWITFGNETINLDTVTHITLDKQDLSDGTSLPFIRFNFVDGTDSVRFNMLTWDKKPILAYHEAMDWLKRLQGKET